MSLVPIPLDPPPTPDQDVPEVADEVRSMGGRTNNAQLIADCARLGYLAQDWPTLDPTYGLGRWWKEWRPTQLAAHDLDPAKAPDGAMDFRDLQYSDESFLAVAFDPRYKLSGSMGDGGPATADPTYGVTDRYVSVESIHADMRAGITEALRVLRPSSRAGGGYLLVKCQDQVASGQVQWQTRIMADHGESHDGVTLIDSLHVMGYRRQPPGRRQVHARRDYSTLLVFHKRR